MVQIQTQTQTNAQLIWRGVVRGFKAGVILSGIYTLMVDLLWSISGSAGAFFFVLAFGAIFGILPAALLGAVSGGAISSLIVKVRLTSDLAAVCLSLGIAALIVIPVVLLLHSLWQLMVVPYIAYSLASVWAGLKANHDWHNTQARQL